MSRFFLLLFLIPVIVIGQNTIGLPDVLHYNKQSYTAGLQNWDIKQDKNGLIFIANNEGLLCFDGNYWSTYSLPNKTIVRSLEITDDGRIYVGGQDEMGYFTPSTSGKLQYTSLTPLIPAKDQTFGDVWDIISTQKDVFFRSPGKIFKLSQRTIETYYPSSEWGFLGKCNGTVIAQDYKSGLMTFRNQQWQPIESSNSIPSNVPVTGILEISPQESIVTTLKGEIFKMSGNTLKKIPCNALTNERIYTTSLINQNWIAIGTSNSGLFIIDYNGNVIQQFSKKDGLQNNNVLCVFSDRQKNLWLGLNNGIDMIAYNSAIKQINPLLQDGSGYAAIVYENKLFIGTSNGLFNVPIQNNASDLSFTKGEFSLIPSTKGQTWNLSEINNTLLLGHHEGAFAIKGNNITPLSNLEGFWNFTPLSNTYPSAKIIAGNYKGLIQFDFNNNKNFIQSAQIPNFNESCRFVAIDQQENIWVSHPYHGVYKIPKINNEYKDIEVYTQKNGLPSSLNNHVYKIKNQLLVATEKGIYNYDANKNLFTPSDYYQKLLGNKSIRYLKEDEAGNIWFIHEKQIGVVDYSEKNPKVIELPELTGKMLSGFEFIYSINNQNILLGGEKSFFHINYEKYKQNKPLMAIHIKTVKINDINDSLIYGGFSESTNGNNKSLPKKNINHNWKSISFSFSAPVYGYESNIEYSYQLEGYEETWSNWSKLTEKEFTNLPAGNYTFHVKARSNFGNESNIASYSFTILPPWYQTIWARLLYLASALLLLFYYYTRQKKKFILQQTKHQDEQQKLQYIFELEKNKSESELVALGKEKLEAEINFKNSELASSAMHLVKKGELLSKIKADLSKIIKEIENPHAIGELKKMIKSLGEDDNMDKEWESFSKHFDKVQSDFLIELKEKHTTITGNELKLSAYLRMNLSTKEIAQLMNISVRGVEISRYRLRKKLGIPTEISLFDYLAAIQRKDKPENG